MVFMGWAGVIFTSVKPLILSAYKDQLGFGDELAGYLVSIETLGNCFGALLVASKIHVWDRRAIGITALLIMILGNLASLTLTTFPTLAPMRFSVGVGEGLAMGVMSGTLAGTARPDRNFAIYTASFLLVGVLGFLGMSSLLESFGIRGAYYFLLLMLVPAAATVLFLPRSGPPTALKVAGYLADLPLKKTIVLVTGSVIAYLGIGGFSPFTAEIGKTAGLTGQSLSNVLAAAQFCGFLGAMLAIWQNLRWGRTRPIVFGLLAMSASVAAVLLAPTSSLVFSIAIPAFLFLWLYFFSYLAGATAALDSRGRTTTLMFTTTSIGYTVGPAMNGWIAEHTGGYAAVEMLTIGCLIASIALIAPVSRTDPQLGRLPRNAGLNP